MFHDVDQERVLMPDKLDRIDCVGSIYFDQFIWFGANWKSFPKVKN